MTPQRYDYPELALGQSCSTAAFHLTMYCYLSHVEDGRLTLREHAAARWLKPEELNSVRWLPADLRLIEQLKPQPHQTSTQTP